MPAGEVGIRRARYRDVERCWLLLLTGFGVWLVAGGLAGSALALWTVGPSKTPMAWSEGALMSYQGNAESPATTARRRNCRWLDV